MCESTLMHFRARGGVCVCEREGVVGGREGRSESKLHVSLLQLQLPDNLVQESETARENIILDSLAPSLLLLLRNTTFTFPWL